MSSEQERWEVFHSFILFNNRDFDPIPALNSAPSPPPQAVTPEPSPEPAPTVGDGASPVRSRKPSFRSLAEYKRATGNFLCLTCLFM